MERKKRHSGRRLSTVFFATVAALAASAMLVGGVVGTAKDGPRDRAAKLARKQALAACLAERGKTKETKEAFRALYGKRPLKACVAKELGRIKETKEAFRALYGKRQLKACVAKRLGMELKAEKRARREAKARCQGLRGKERAHCVRKAKKKARARVALLRKNEISAKHRAAKMCAQERAADPVAFKQKYGTSKNRKGRGNAFGRGVLLNALRR